MDRNKIEKAAKLDVELTNLEIRIKKFEENGDISHFYDLALYLSSSGYAAVSAAVLFEARTDRLNLETEIAQL